MKLIFDENISFRIVRKITTMFPDSIHVTDVIPLLQGDSLIFDYARLHDFTIVTFDEDFTNLQAIKGFPPKIIWLRMGNTSTLSILNKLSQKKDDIENFIGTNELSILEIY